MDREDTPNPEELRRKTLAAHTLADLAGQSNSGRAEGVGHPGSVTSTAEAQPSDNSEVVVATQTSSSTSANGTAVNNNYMLINTQQLRSVVLSVLPEIIEAVISKVKSPPLAAVVQQSAHDAENRREGRCEDRGLIGSRCTLPMNLEWRYSVEREVNWREFPCVGVPSKVDCSAVGNEPDSGESDVEILLQLVSQLVNALNFALKKKRKKLNLVKVSCSICCDGNLTHMLPCRHCYCEACILKFMEGDQTCPACRKRFATYQELLR